ncbi:MAG: riboflavin biosynthesis protein RibD, partial [Alphaproteobacteria bacterium]
MQTDPDFMATALRLARRGLGNAWPNPAVGCVIVSGGPEKRILGRGWTQPGGRPHSETVALDQARARFGAQALVGASAYVTLEPC